MHHRNAAVLEVFSTITSPVFSELVIVLKDHAMTRLPQEVTLFETLRNMNGVRTFKSVFLFEGPYLVQEGGRWVTGEPRRALKELVDSMAAKGFLDFLNSPATIR